MLSELFSVFFGVCLFFLTNTRIDADEQGIRVIAPHGVYAMDCSLIINH